MTDVEKKKKKLHDDLKKLVEDTKDLLGTTADVSGNAAKTARAQVEASLQSVQDHVESGISAAEDKAEEQLHILDQRVRANPYKTMGISFGVGVLLGFIIGHK